MLQKPSCVHLKNPKREATFKGLFKAQVFPPSQPALVQTEGQSRWGNPSGVFYGVGMSQYVSEIRNSGGDDTLRGGKNSWGVFIKEAGNVFVGTLLVYGSTTI